MHPSYFRLGVSRYTFEPTILDRYKDDLELLISSTHLPRIFTLTAKFNPTESSLFKVAMQLVALLSLAATVTAASSHLTKRCSPVYDPDLALGYLPPAPCWQTFTPDCQPKLSNEMTLVVKHKLAILYGLSEYCVGHIEEELAREAAGRKNNNWVRTHGNLNLIGGGTLVISNMSDAAVARYDRLTYPDGRTRDQA
ncbi:hypothetical protein QBC40DRAFT_289166 [Triangularia verruculosa]|uniref:Uncharacterized protein n=1 Tax=Triangularia verruculosa TaxID=2587418 RepID=A0AAN6XB64_9PEZI|nr:hypothetical protein QBC40DRAFT_289166 [Triangularia verruculosa]